jgi:SAM-dependent methyltransferase
MKNSLYSKPLYYEIAFSFIDPEKQVDLFEEYISQYSQIKVDNVLDIGCGPSLQLRELAARGYEAIGLDLNKEMLGYLEKRAQEEKVAVRTIKQDMRAFSLGEKVDFAFIMMGTIGSFKSNQEMFNHLISVADNLKSGGVYLIENFSLDWRKEKLFKPQKWTMKKEGVTVKTTFSLELQDVKKQLLREKLVFKVSDNGIEQTFEETGVVKLIFPQEFLEIVERTTKFEFIGWFERNSTKRLKKADNDNIAILRRL